MMGRNHARVLQQLDGVEFVGAADIAGDTSGAVGVHSVVDSVEELIDIGMDMCVVALPTEQHLDAGLKLAEAGIATLLEKPLSATTLECEELVRAFKKTDTVGCVGHIERFNPALVSLRARLNEGALGEVFQVATRRQGPFPNRIRDVGVIKDLATHDLDLTAWLAGSMFDSISARTAHKTGREHEDLVAATGKLSNGVVTNHLVNWLSPMKERVTIVTGELGCFVADTLTADLTFCANGSIATEWSAVAAFRGVTEGDVVRYAISKPEPLLTELTEFRKAAGGEDAEVVSLESGAEAVRVAEACIRSSQTGTTVEL